MPDFEVHVAETIVRSVTYRVTAPDEESAREQFLDDSSCREMIDCNDIDVLDSEVVLVVPIPAA
jgi:hypothetical protein